MITDLTGTKWQLNQTLSDLPQNDSGGKVCEYALTFASPYNMYSWLTMMDDGMPSGVISLSDDRDLDMASNHIAAAGLIIEITGGEDATSTELIQWFPSNAEQIIEPQTNKILGTDGLGELIAILKEELANAGSSVPTITIALSQVVSQNPLQIQLTNEQYDALAASQVAVVDATALGISWLVSIFKMSEDSSYINFRATVYNWDVASADVRSNDAYAIHIVKSTKILTQYIGNFYAGIYNDADGWNPAGGDNDGSVRPEFVEDVIAATYASATNITSGSTFPNTVVRDYITSHLPIRINDALCHFVDFDASTAICRYFTATMNGALVHLNIIEINTSTWVVTFNQVDVGASPNVDQDLTANTCFTLDATAFASLVSTHTATIASPVFTGLSNAYEFVTIKASINSVYYNIKLTRNATNKYSGLFFIEDSSHLYEVTVYYNGTSVYLRCATVY